jgi:hypothetical protein
MVLDVAGTSILGEIVWSARVRELFQRREIGGKG